MDYLVDYLTGDFPYKQELTSLGIAFQVSRNLMVVEYLVLIGATTSQSTDFSIEDRDGQPVLFGDIHSKD